MNKTKLLLLLPIFSLFIMGNTIKQEDVSVIVGEIDTPVYNMEITWDKMEFTYSETINYIWNKNTHVYDLSNSTYKWDSNENNIYIKNNSYMSVNMKLNYTGNNQNITGTFSVKDKTIDSGKSITSKLTLNGELSKNNTSYIKVGTINLTIS